MDRGCKRVTRASVAGRFDRSSFQAVPWARLSDPDRNGGVTSETVEDAQSRDTAPGFWQRGELLARRTQEHTRCSASKRRALRATPCQLS